MFAATNNKPRRVIDHTSELSDHGFCNVRAPAPRNVNRTSFQRRVPAALFEISSRVVTGMIFVRVAQPARAQSWRLNAGGYMRWSPKPSDAPASAGLTFSVIATITPLLFTPGLTSLTKMAGGRTATATGAGCRMHTASRDINR